MGKLLKYIICGAIVVVVVVNLTVYMKSRSYIYKTIEDVPEAQAVLIPGASISSDGTPSPFFQDRVDRGLELYENKKVEKILVTGDNSSVAHNEVNPIRDYLIEKGVPEEDIFLDHAGFDTYSSMYRARDIFQAKSVIIATQSFHLPRAVFLARSLGLEAYGVYVDEGHIPPDNYVREIFANVKAGLNLLAHRVPKFLGETIPLTGPSPDYPDSL